MFNTLSKGSCFVWHTSYITSNKESNERQVSIAYAGMPMPRLYCPRVRLGGANYIFRKGPKELLPKNQRTLHVDDFGISLSAVRRCSYFLIRFTAMAHPKSIYSPSSPFAHRHQVCYEKARQVPHISFETSSYSFWRYHASITVVLCISWHFMEK